MKGKAEFGYILRLTLTLLLICALAAAILGGVNAITKDRIAENKEVKTRQALAEVLPGAEGMTLVEEGSGVVQAVYAPSKDSAVQGWAVQVAPNGFGGAIVMIVGVDAEGSVCGISIVSHAETPGLGAVAAAATPAGEGFRGSFYGKSGSLGLDDIDAMSGATITSKAVLDGVNAALDYVAGLR
jgi:electron transport complex protein RnfG